MENYNKILSQNNGTVSLQVTHLENIEEGFSGIFDNIGLIKNLSEDNIEVEILMESKYVTTIMYPGWNPELVSGIKNSPSDLQFGY